MLADWARKQWRKEEREKGRAEGHVEGRAEERKAWRTWLREVDAWEARKAEAEEAGRDFTESRPARRGLGVSIVAVIRNRRGKDASPVLLVFPYPACPASQRSLASAKARIAPSTLYGASGDDSSAHSLRGCAKKSPP